MEHSGEDKEVDRGEFLLGCREHQQGLADFEDIDEHEHGTDFAQIENEVEFTKKQDESLA
mgnify:CR=1 FL=1